MVEGIKTKTPVLKDREAFCVFAAIADSYKIQTNVARNEVLHTQHLSDSKHCPIGSKHLFNKSDNKPR